ncbi:SdpI family protein [Ulvibacterium sp.]|uniref:SdpI family protein n=1 Tax=Ulvibacterium sp. TaxID=2665914 RepID=UPI00345D4ED3
MISLFVIPAVLVLFSLFWIFYPPINRNRLYGYRSGRSLRSDSAWRKANFICSRVLLVISILIFLMQLVAFLIIGTDNDEVVTVLTISYVILIFSIIPITEISLSEKSASNEINKENS